MKRCPYCAEEIQDDAVKCRYCGEFLDRSRRGGRRWYFSTSVVVIAVLCVGPLALPLVWLNPRYTIVVKIVASVIIVAMTIALLYLVAGLYQRLFDQLKAMGG